MEKITIKEVTTKKDLRIFIYLPEKIHRNDPDWLPPIYMDEWSLFDRKKNNAFSYSDAILLLAIKENRIAGRIMGIINKKYNNITGDEHARFGFIECIDDQKVFHALISRIEEWAKQKGMGKIVGPLGFSDKDPQGFQFEGFGQPPFITSPTNSPYMIRLIAAEGYTKKIDLVNYLGKMPEEFPPVYERAMSRLKANHEFNVIQFPNKKALKPYIIPVLELMNEAFADIYAFVPLTDEEKVDLAKNYFPILDPKFVTVIEKEGQLVGFAVGIPDPSPGIKACRGRLYPFGIFKLLREIKKSKKLLMMLGGIRKEFRGNGFDVLMGARILQEGIKNGMETIDSHLVLEDNLKMRGEYERIGCEVVKRFRIYQKEL